MFKLSVWTIAVVALGTLLGVLCAAWVLARIIGGKDTSVLALIKGWIASIANLAKKDEAEVAEAETPEAA